MEALLFCVGYLLIGVVLCGVIDRKTDFLKYTPEGIRGVCVVFWPLVFIYIVLVLIDLAVRFISKKDY